MIQMDITIRQLDKKQIQVLLDMLLGRAKWLECINQPMWNTANLNPVHFEKMYPGYRPFLVYHQEVIVGGFILLDQDDFLWNKEEISQKSLYIHKLVIKSEFSGNGYAHECMEHILELALQEKVQYLRLDCYGDREYLMKLYEDCNFYKKRNVVMEDNTVIQLFERTL